MEMPNDIYPRFQIVRTLAKFAGAFGVVQSIIWIGFAITGMLAYYCVLDFEDISLNLESSLQLTFFEVYFQGTCSTKYPDFEKLRDMTVLSPSSINICLWIYLVLNAFWLVSSISLIRNVDIDHLRCTNVTLYIWIFITLDIMALDLGLSIVFGLDYDKFSAASSADDVNEKPFKDMAIILVSSKVVSISMLIMAAKGFILWVINLCLAIYFFVETFTINEAAISQTSLVNQDVISDTHSIHKRTPITAYEANNTIQNNVQVKLNTEALERANKMSLISLKERLAKRQNSDPDRFKEYAPRWEPNVPDPDYTPPMPRSQLFHGRNTQPQGNTRF